MAYEAIVVGAGIEGSATAYQLVKKGVKNVLLLEQVGNNKYFRMDVLRGLLPHKSERIFCPIT